MIVIKILGILFSLALIVVGLYSIISIFVYNAIDIADDEEMGIIGIGMFVAALMAGIGIKLFGFICGWWPW